MALDRDTLKGDLPAAMNTAKDERPRSRLPPRWPTHRPHTRGAGHRRKVAVGSVVYPQSADGKLS
jgi:hypothetical protein